MSTPSTGTSSSKPATTPATTAPAATTPATTGLDGPTPADLLPTTGNYPTEIVRYRSVVLTDILGAKPARKLTGAIDLGEENLPFYDRPAEGMVVTTEQTWSAQGVTLGRLLHSLALAPGESTRVAVVDWQRSTKATGTETTAEADTLSATTDQNRSISEVANAIAREEQHGSSEGFQRSQSSSSGGSIGVSFFGIGGGGNWSNSSNTGFTTAVSRSTGVKSVAEEATQRISARTQQLATAARSRNMTVVRETTQSEKDQVVTRVVTNYNHMHAMSVQYYEVVQVYSVTTKPTKLERCLFIPLQELTFTYSSLQRYKEILASVAPTEWAAKIRASNPYDTSVRKLDACLAPEAPTAQDFDGVDLADLSGSPMGVYGVRKYDGSPVRFDPVSRQWNPMPTTGLDSGLTRIAPGKDTVWALRADNTLMRFDGTTWTADPQGWKGLGLACGADGVLYIVGGDSRLWQRSPNGTWTDMNAVADDVAVVGKDKVSYCRQGKLWTRSGTTWQERPVPSLSNVQRISATSDGALWCFASDGKAYPLDYSAATLNALKDYLVTMFTASAKIVSSVNGEFWLLRSNGVLTRVLTAAREAPVPFDAAPKADTSYASKIDVWYDEFGIRSIQVVFPGQTFRCGDTGGSGVQRQASYTFGGADKLISVDAWSGTAARGSLAGLRLTMTSGVANFGIAATTTVAPDLTEDAGGASAICGLFGSTVKTGSRTYVASIGFHVRGGNVSQAVLDHLNDNRRHYSQAVWAHADELTLSRILANYSYTPAGSNAAPVLLGTLLDPKPIAATGNYLGFRWNFSSEKERDDWTATRKAGDNTFGTPSTTTIAIATKGVFAEAVLGRANSAEKIDLTRFWNWKDSPIQITPADIAPVSTGSRAKDLDTTVAALAASQAKFTPLVTMPDPVGLQSVQAITTANLFRDMSGLSTMSQVLAKGIEAASNNDKAVGERAQEAFKTATEHQQKMAQIALDAAAKVAPAIAGVPGGGAAGAGNLSALGGMLNQGGKADAKS
ncbi:hypothetical protein [Streptomyces sp. NRRL WC-3742]|uniref:hypothetical protein n=1 Tax=Streptomyces sp. NRRL WC-3742 TaxID=1463934 RepID=UPI0006911886|nr:hypothetical protein [Streptomyces sp. NRRL WC-3742]